METCGLIPVSRTQYSLVSRPGNFLFSFEKCIDYHRNWKKWPAQCQGSSLLGVLASSHCWGAWLNLLSSWNQGETGQGAGDTASSGIASKEYLEIWTGRCEIYLSLKKKKKAFQRTSLRMCINPSSAVTFCSDVPYLSLFHSLHNILWWWCFFSPLYISGPSAAFSHNSLMSVLAAGAGGRSWDGGNWTPLIQLASCDSRRRVVPGIDGLGKVLSCSNQEGANPRKPSRAYEHQRGQESQAGQIPVLWRRTQAASQDSVEPKKNLTVFSTSA